MDENLIFTRNNKKKETFTRSFLQLSSRKANHFPVESRTLNIYGTILFLNDFSLRL